MKVNIVKNLDFSFYILEPTDAGIIPPEYRTSFHGQGSNQASSVTVTQAQNSLQCSTITEPSTGDKKLHQWSTNPVEEWAKEQVINYIYRNVMLLSTMTLERE